MPTNYGAPLFDRFFATLPGRATLKGTRLLAELNLRRHDARNTLAALARDIDRHGAARRRALRERIGVLLDALDAPRPGAGGTRGLLAALIEALQPLDPPKAWLMLGVLGGRLPAADDVVTAVRLAQTDGPVAALRPAIWSGPAARLLDSGPFPPVEVISGAVLVDVDHTAKVDFATGIQRVTRESVRRWAGAPRRGVRRLARRPTGAAPAHPARGPAGLLGWAGGRRPRSRPDPHPGRTAPTCCPNWPPRPSRTGRAAVAGPALVEPDGRHRLRHVPDHRAGDLRRRPCRPRSPGTWPPSGTPTTSPPSPRRPPWSTAAGRDDARRRSACPARG